MIRLLLGLINKPLTIISDARITDRTEAALVAALTGFGMASGAAVSAVLTYRLITYWLPVLPGWLSWNLLRRWAYV